MYLRKLEKKDAPFMLEWMLDDKVIEYLHGIYSQSKMEDALHFIEDYVDDELHFAICNDEDEYTGTTSLRHINQNDRIAEFAIVVRHDFWTKGYAWQGMIETLDYAFNMLDLDSIYWRVKRTNERAIRFFLKHGFNMLDEDVPPEILHRYSNEKDLVWFAVLKGDDYVNAALLRGNVAGCKVIKIKTVPTIEAGELSFFEGSHDFDFDIKRIYYISKVPEGVRRGFHAHKELKQLLFCPYGKIQILLENENGREEITLSDPSVGIVIDKPTWREMLWLQKDSVLCVAASDYYDPQDYIRDYECFRNMLIEEVNSDG